MRPDPAAKFTGQLFDAAPGLYYYGARYYDASVGHFTQPDPIVEDLRRPQTLSRYAYVSNDPLNATDPTGNFLVPAELSPPRGGSSYPTWPERCERSLAGHDSRRFWMPSVTRRKERPCKGSSVGSY